MTINKINELDEIKLEAEKNLKKINEMLENPQITQQLKDEITTDRDKHLTLTNECTLTKYYLKQELKKLEKKYKSKINFYRFFPKRVEFKIND